eukprot:Rmarinus@m.16703
MPGSVEPLVKKTRLPPIQTPGAGSDAAVSTGNGDTGSSANGNTLAQNSGDVAGGSMNCGDSEDLAASTVIQPGIFHKELEFENHRLRVFSYRGIIYFYLEDIVAMEPGLAFDSNKTTMTEFDRRLFKFVDTLIPGILVKVDATTEQGLFKLFLINQSRPRLMRLYNYGQTICANTNVTYVPPVPARWKVVVTSWQESDNFVAERMRGKMRWKGLFKKLKREHVKKGVIDAMTSMAAEGKQRKGVEETTQILAKYGSDHPGWRFRGKREGVLLFSMTDKDPAVFTVRGQFYTNFPIEEVFPFFWQAERCMLWDDLIKDAFEIERIAPDMKVDYSAFTNASGMRLRDAVEMKSFRKLDPLGYEISGSSVVHEKMPKRENHIRVNVHVTGVTLRPAYKVEVASQSAPVQNAGFGSHAPSSTLTPAEQARAKALKSMDWKVVKDRDELSELRSAKTHHIGTEIDYMFRIDMRGNVPVSVVSYLHLKRPLVLANIPEACRKARDMGLPVYNIQKETEDAIDGVNRGLDSVNTQVNKLDRTIQNATDMITRTDLMSAQHEEAEQRMKSFRRRTFEELGDVPEDAGGSTTAKDTVDKSSPDKSRKKRESSLLTFFWGAPKKSEENVALSPSPEPPASSRGTRSSVMFVFDAVGDYVKTVGEAVGEAVFGSPSKGKSQSKKTTTQPATTSKKKVRKVTTVTSSAKDPPTSKKAFGGPSGSDVASGKSTKKKGKGKSVGTKKNKKKKGTSTGVGGVMAPTASSTAKRRKSQEPTISTVGTKQKGGGKSATNTTAVPNETNSDDDDDDDDDDGSGSASSDGASSPVADDVGCGVGVGVGVGEGKDISPGDDEDLHAKRKASLAQASMYRRQSLEHANDPSKPPPTVPEGVGSESFLARTSVMFKAGTDFLFGSMRKSKVHPNPSETPASPGVSGGMKRLSTMLFGGGNVPSPRYSENERPDPPGSPVPVSR